MGAPGAWHGTRPRGARSPEVPPSTAAVALALLVSLSPFLSEAPARGAITVDTSAGDADARASFDVNGDGTLDPSEIDVAGPVQGDDIVLDAGIESSSAHGERHTTVSAAGSSLSISSRGVCSGRTVLTGDHEKDLRRGGGGEAGRHIEFTLTQPGTFARPAPTRSAPSARAWRHGSCSSAASPGSTRPGAAGRGPSP